MFCERINQDLHAAAALTLPIPRLTQQQQELLPKTFNKLHTSLFVIAFNSHLSFNWLQPLQSHEIIPIFMLSSYSCKPTGNQPGLLFCLITHFVCIVFDVNMDMITLMPVSVPVLQPQ